MVSSLTEMCCFSSLENKYKLRVHQSNYMFIKEILQHLGSLNPGKYSRIISATDQLITIAYQMFSSRMTVRTLWTFGQLPRGARKYTALVESMGGTRPKKLVETCCNSSKSTRDYTVVFQIKQKTLEYLKLKNLQKTPCLEVYIIINP